LRYFFHIAYKGTKYRGWQRQPNVISVQEALEDVLADVFGKKLAVSGCGRTDAEVHASQYFFHLDLEIAPTAETVFIINKRLPKDIAVYDIIEVGEKASARFDAIIRTYNYCIHFSKMPFNNDLSSLYEGLELDYSKMRSGLQLLMKYDDYRAFCKSPDSHNTTICHFKSAELFEEENGIRLEFKANRYLKGMIRIIVYRLLELGKGKLSLEDFEYYLITKVSEAAVQSAYPQGLYLSHVLYPYLNLPTRKFGGIG